VTAGGTTAFISYPADQALLRMKNDLDMPVEMRKNYTGLFDTTRKMFAEDGIRIFFKGALPTVLRSMALNMGMFATFE
jgi:solute carrier family 25 oxoglutarate transporter 11